MAKKTTKKLIRLSVDISWMNEEEAINEIFKAIKEEGLNPEKFLYTATGLENEIDLEEKGTYENEQFFYAFTFDEVKSFEYSDGTLYEKIRRQDRPIIALHYSNKCVTVDSPESRWDQDEVERVFEEKYIGNPAYAYDAKKGSLKSAYAGLIEIFQD